LLKGRLSGLFKGIGGGFLWGLSSLNRGTGLKMGILVPFSGTFFGNIFFR
jgi:hypothetical protein